MPIQRTVEEGDSVVKFAAEYGFFPDTIWNDAANAELKTKRKDMNILAPGDAVQIPDRRDRVAPCETSLRHVFRRRGVPMIFRVQLFERNEPRKKQPYVLTVDGAEHTGVTDDEGKIEVYLPNKSEQGRLNVNHGDIDMEVRFGYMDPVAEPSGVKKRLANLGFDCGDSGEELDQRTISALRSFQVLIGLEPTGELDTATRDALTECHDQPEKLEQKVKAAAEARLGGLR